MSELIRTKCITGQLVVTKQAICLGQKSVLRSTLTGVILRKYPKLLGLGGKHVDITFFSHDGIIKAKVVKIGDAHEIMSLLGAGKGA